ncbi:MAG: non-ribosomal peptide synthase [Cyanobacteria bacterium]|jgi:hypothetical protein|nr:non-ribosomal peptide synthase [Cyanobacteria bacterium GSL.Bin1]
MSDLSALLNHLNQQGIQLWRNGEQLKINAPKGTLTPQLRAELAAHKTEILAFLDESKDSSCQTATGLSLQTIGRLLGGFNTSSSIPFQSPIIDPMVMAKQLKVTLRPLPKGFENEVVGQFREELKLKLQDYGVQIIPWEEATRDFAYDLSIPLTPWKKTVKTRVVKPEISAVIDVERPTHPIKSFLAEKFYQIYAQFFLPNKSIATITQLTAWAEDHTIQRLEDPTATQVILLSELDREFVSSKLPYPKKIALGVNTLVKNFSEIAIGISEQEISILNMNLSDSLFPREQFDHFILKSLIPKIYVPIAPLPLSRFQISDYHPQDSTYAIQLQQLSQNLASTGLFPSGFQLGEVVKRQSHRDIVDVIVNGRTGVSYGFVAYAEPPQYIGDREIPASVWESLLPVEGFSTDEVRQNEAGRRYLKTQIKGEYAYKQIPDIWLLCSRSGADKTNLSLERDIIRIGLKNSLCLQIPEGIDLNQVDIKPSYDTYVMVAIALSAALYAPHLIEQGAPMIHFHGYPAKDWFAENEDWAGVEHPSVPCGTYESGVFNFLSVYQLANRNYPPIALASLIEPDHGANMITSDPEYLLARLNTGIENGQIELGGKHFASLSERPLAVAKP